MGADDGRHCENFDQIEEKLNLMIQLLSADVTSLEDAKPMASIAAVREVQSGTLLFPMRHDEEDETKRGKLSFN